MTLQVGSVEQVTGKLGWSYTLIYWFWPTVKCYLTKYDAGK